LGKSDNVQAMKQLAHCWFSLIDCNERETYSMGVVNMNEMITRRALVKGGLAAGALIPVAGLFISGAAYADLPALDPNDPAARGRDYVTKSAKSDAYCGNCSLYKKAGDAVGSCALFAGKSVEFAGWCSGWVKIGTP
jgi:High potential iron-sulfur protein